MADEIISAIIQAVGSLLGGIGAAVVAVKAATKGLENWKREAPGRRRLEVAEQCLVQAYATRDSIMDFAFAVDSHISYDLRFEEEMPRDERTSRHSELRLVSEASRSKLDELQATTRLAQLYFSDELKYALHAMKEHRRFVNDVNREYISFDDFSEDRRIKEKKAVLLKLQPSIGTETYDADIERYAASVRMYEAILRPHLSVLSH